MKIKLTDQTTGRTMTMYKDDLMDAVKALQRYLNQQKYDRDSSIYQSHMGYVLEHNRHTWIAKKKSKERN